jgi:hypothetical protein
MLTYFQRVERHSPIERMHESHLLNDSILLVHGFDLGHADGACDEHAGV